MKHLRIDPVACDAFGFCAELFPEAITLDEWGYPIIDGRPLTADVEPHARAAVIQCPRKALFIEDSASAAT
jgi:ferredoxin